jgi:hypothetical protein
MSQAGIVSASESAIIPGNVAIDFVTNSGTAVSVANTIELVTANTTVQFAGAGNVITQNFGLTNLLLGSSGSFLTSGTQNTALGDVALREISSGQLNTAVGSAAAQNLQSGNDNCFFGCDTAADLQTGSSNVIIGQDCAPNTVNCNGCIAIGTGTAAQWAQNEQYNICISNVGVGGESNTIRIGTQGTGAFQQNICYIAGITGATVTGTAVLCSSSGQLGTISSSIRYKENVKPLEKEISVLNLNPVSFTYKTDPSKTTQYGLIAEDIERDFPYLAFYNDRGEIDSVRYHELPTLLLHEIKKLNKRIEELERKSK